MPIDYSIPILIVDDEQVMVSLVRRVVSKLGFEQIDHAADGDHAWSMLRERKYQLVISDLNMQPMSGLQLLRTIRKDDTLRSTPFLLMTGSSSPGSPLAAKGGGADAYLLKPFTPQQLRAKLNDIFSGQGGLGARSWVRIFAPYDGPLPPETQSSFALALSRPQSRLRGNRKLPDRALWGMGSLLSALSGRRGFYGCAREEGLEGRKSSR
jgi:two-component system, chemotaxis family, chemotaxis protein CheY